VSEVGPLWKWVYYLALSGAFMGAMARCQETGTVQVLAEGAFQVNTYRTHLPYPVISAFHNVLLAHDLSREKPEFLY